ncbi:MAG: DUF1576 domain-containing protein [Sedimentibacter sp.]|uniref:DUF1576 domain-containing protein n=1 Tax=Sedimentibacter sp. TaxID=1960295 RepID=UPI0031595043
MKILLFFPTVLIVFAFIFDAPSSIAKGLYSIVISKDILLTDYLAVGGIGAAFLNAAVLAYANIYIIHRLKVKITGPVLAGLLTITGFSFFGKNVFNVWPIYLGGLLYAKYQKTEFKNVLIVMMFSTALAPIVTEVTFGLSLSYDISVPLGISIGMFCGFVAVPLAANMNKLHDGYNLYNIGFTAGLIGTIINSLLRSFDINISQQQILSSDYEAELQAVLVIFFLFLIVLGFVKNGKSFKGYSGILKHSGRLVTDFTQLDGYSLTFVNMGIMGFISMMFVVILGGTFNGPVFGSVLTVAGFAAFGKHPKNTIPILTGIFVAGMLKIWDLSSTSVIIAGLFGTTLAPIAGRYGFFAGAAAGFLHLSVVMNVGIIHGGINLYNNGFSGGIVASLMFPVLEALKKGD